MNIGSSNDDAFFRYKMPSLQTVVRGRGGNGVHTVLMNIEDVAKALKRPSIYLSKYFASTLGSVFRIDKKAMNAHILNGEFSRDDLASPLDKFISSFVLCGTCNLPETDLKVKEASGKISLRCRACGSKTKVSEETCLFKYILSHPPNEKLSAHF